QDLHGEQILHAYACIRTLESEEASRQQSSSGKQQYSQGNFGYYKPSAKTGGSHTGRADSATLAKRLLRIGPGRPESWHEAEEQTAKRGAPTREERRLPVDGNLIDARHAIGGQQG